MNRILCVAVLVCGWSLAAMAGSGGTGGAGAVAADGLLQFEPPQSLGCVALRVDVPADKMVVGMRWFNGTAGRMPSRECWPARAAPTSPPPQSAAVPVAENIVGSEQEWSAIQFATPVASESGTLFLVVEYPADYAPPAEGPALGVGFAQDQATYPYFVSGDGENWIRVASACRVLLEPMLADRIPGVLALSEPRKVDAAIPLERSGLLATPNPFNPQTSIALYLKQAGVGDVRIYDLRGHLVTELYRGPLNAGENRYLWDGRDRSGRGVASGAYWVQARTPDQVHTLKIMLLR
jgi:hypothetical protein